MNFVPTASDYALVVNFSSVEKIDVSLQELLQELADIPVAVHSGLVIFGPLFGGEVAANIKDKLEKVGLVYFDDFFIMEPIYPEWCAIGVGLRAPATR